LGSILGMILFLGVVFYLLAGVYFLYAVGICIGLGLFTLLHYWLWGRALLREVADERAEALAQEAREAAAADAPWERRYS
jgi:hypothetical protein